MTRRWTAAGLLGLALTAGALAADPKTKTLFDGKSGDGWILNKGGGPLPRANIQDGAINPHDSGGYIVVHEEQYQDFVLEFDYKLSPKCNSGVFLRVGDLKDPVHTGLEIALDDSTGTGLHDPGAFYDLVPPKVNAQKPIGEWNHMKITAKGPKITIALNGQDVSAINLSEWPEAGKRPDGSDHKFKKLAFKDLNRAGYLGFQDHKSPCWFKNVTLQELD